MEVVQVVVEKAMARRVEVGKVAGRVEAVMVEVATEEATMEAG